MSKKKGNRTKTKAKKYYEKKGWLVDDCEKGSRFVKNKDLFNLFDLVAIKGKVVLFIQVKTNRRPKKISYIEFAKKHASATLKIIGITWFDYKNWVIQEFLSNGEIKETDLR